MSIKGRSVTDAPPIDLSSRISILETLRCCVPNEFEQNEGEKDAMALDEATLGKVRELMHEVRAQHCFWFKKINPSCFLCRERVCVCLQ